VIGISFDVRGDLMKYDRTNYNRLYAGELEDWRLEEMEED
jgi:hypothetical protein